MTVRRTRRWRGVVATALFAGAVGIVFARPLVLLLGVVGAAFAAYPHFTSTPKVNLDIERDLSDASADEGDDVEVTVRVTNVGDNVLADLRIVDGVPPMLTVSRGTPRHAAVLRPGSTTEFSYHVAASYGRHQFDPATVIARDVAGTRELETDVAATTELDCTEAVPEVPLRRQSEQHAGRLVTNEGGSGIEFHQTREYQHGDPMNRIDWRRAAKTGKLTTIEFREERTASVVVLVDAGVDAYRARADEEPNAVSYCVGGAEQVLASLANTRNFVGVAAIGREFVWLGPGTGPEHGDEARQLLATHPTLSTVPPNPDRVEASEGGGSDGDDGNDGDDGDGDGGDGGDYTRWNLDAQRAELQKRLGSNVQVVLLSPLADDSMVTTALGLEANGTAVTVVSPDVTTTETVGGRLAALERENRMSALRQSGVPVVDWDPEDQQLGTELLRAGGMVA